MFQTYSEKQYFYIRDYLSFQTNDFATGTTGKEPWVTASPFYNCEFLIINFNCKCYKWTIHGLLRTALQARANQPFLTLF